MVPMPIQKVHYLNYIPDHTSKATLIHFCEFGNQMRRTALPIISKIEGTGDLNPVMIAHEIQDLYYALDPFFYIALQDN